MNTAVPHKRSRSIAAARLLRIAWFALNAMQLIFTALWTAGWISLALAARLLTRGRRRPLRMAARCWAPGLLAGAGARLRVEGLDRVDWSRPHVLVANHQSIIDVCALFRAVPVPLRFVLKQALSGVPFIGAYARAMGMVFIERGGARSSPERLRAAVRMIDEGAHLCAFPEGTRSRDGAVGAFKGGAFQIAIESGAAIVPVAILGSGAVLPAAGFKVRPGTIVVRFGAPIASDAYADRGRQALARLARDAVIALIHDRSALSSQR